MSGQLMHDAITEFLRTGGFSVSSIQVLVREEGDYYVNLQTTDPTILIGQRGEVLMALQHIIKIFLRSKNLLNQQEHLKIDVDSYRLKQESNVLEMADRRARQVMETGRQADLPPMSSFFRRLVHLYVKEKFPQLVTYSQGEGSFRAVCISNESSPGEESPDIYMDLAE